jgi:hypothetical protein
MERRLNAAFIKIFAAHDVLTSVPALQGGDPYGLASPFAKASDFAKASSDKSEDKSEAALHGHRPLSPFRLTSPAVKLRFRAQENHPDNHPGIAAG